MLIPTAALAFAGTNLDDFLVLTVLFGQAGSRQARQKIVLGQCLGLGTLVAVSLLAAAGIRLLPEWLLPWLGLVPILVGIRYYLLSQRRRETEKPAPDLGVLAVAAVTVADGGDNLGVYIPLFSGMTAWQTAATVGVFGGMLLMWLILARAAVRIRGVQRGIERTAHLLIPAALILVGILLLAG